MAQTFSGPVNSIKRHVRDDYVNHSLFYPAFGPAQDLTYSDTIYYNVAVPDENTAAYGSYKTTTIHSSTIWEEDQYTYGDSFGPQLSDTYTAFSGGMTFTCSAPCSLYVMQSPAEDYKYGRYSASDLIGTYAAGTHTITFPTSDIATRAMIYGVIPHPPENAGEYSGNLTDVTMTFAYSDVTTLPAVTAESPVSSNVLAENDNVFRWNYYHPTIPQSGYELHVVRNGTDSVISSAASALPYCVVPADTLTTGTAQWYVRVTAEDGGYTLTAQSEPVYVVVRANPSASDVSTDEKPLLTVSWTAASQQAAQVRVGGTTYPSVWTADGSYRLPEVLDDGVYAVSVRAQTTEGDWSAWSDEIYADIRNEAPSGASAPVVSCTPEGTAAQLRWTETSGASAYILYRGGTPIYAGEGTEYVDLRACGRAVYCVRSVMPSGDYVQSDTITLILQPAHDTLIWTDGRSVNSLTVRLHPRMPERQWDESSDTEFRNYAGRTLPVAVSSGHRTRGLTLTAAYRAPAEASVLLGLLGKTVIYKSNKGEICRGVIVSASRVSGLTDAVTYRITATDDDERAYLT